MKVTILTSLMLLSFGFISTVRADTLEDEYIARLSSKDHRNSQGDRLDSAAAIIRQDRANFHKFGRQDDEDESDGFFASANNRELLEKFLERGSAEKSAIRSILNGTPLIRVRIYEGDDGRNYIRVSVISE